VTVDPREPLPGEGADAYIARVGTSADALPAAEPPHGDHERLDDMGNARRLVHLHGMDLLYAHARKRWHVWDGRRWAEDETGDAERHAKDVVAQMFAAAARADDETRRKQLGAWAVKSASAPRLAALLEVARSEREFAITGREFDRDPWLLTVDNGTLDLRTGALRPHRREDLITRLAPVVYAPAARASRWHEFLDEILGAELAAFLQRAVGYALTGTVSEHAVFLFYGTGANGKSTFLETIRALLGDYARQTDFSSFLVGRDDHVRADLARLAGARFVTAVEAEEGRRFAESLLKQLTGGDTVTARHYYQAHVEFRPEFKLFLATNYKPRVWGTDLAFWRRVRLVPFTVTVPPERQDPNLAAALRAERPGILNWALEGCWHWKTDGLQEPATVIAATRAYQDEQDVVGQFLADRCRLSANGSSLSAARRAVYDAYDAWCRDTGNEPLAARAFGLRLAERGLLEAKRHGVLVWKGLELVPPATPHEREPGEDDDDLGL